MDPALLQTLADNTDEEVMRETVQVFFDDAAERLERIAFSAEMKDLASLRLESHTIKGGARLVGAIQLAELAEALENACRQGQAEAVMELSERMRFTFAATRAAYRDGGFD
jgi:HPt (histidine-containing phosphotransfer) domain-containing protein